MLKTVLLVNHYIYGTVIVKMIYFFLQGIRTIGFFPATENFSPHKDRILTLP